jgi:hypothetical protein
MPEEESLILDLIKEYHMDWKKIAQFLNEKIPLKINRTPRQIYQHY